MRPDAKPYHLDRAINAIFAAGEKFSRQSHRRGERIAAQICDWEANTFAQAIEKGWIVEWPPEITKFGWRALKGG
jgi:Ni,Fe-hydrogenase III large subunit